MKLTKLFLGAAIFFLVLVLSFSAVNAGVVNGVSDGQKQQQPTVPAVPTCSISDTAGGAPTTSISESDGTENLYWLQHSPNQTIFNQKFVIKFLNPSSPLFKQIQKFVFPFGYGGGTVTPFGVPFWGGNPIHGSALLKIKSEAGTCTYFFIVGP